MTLSVRPTGAGLGAEISGVDLSRPLDGPTADAVRAAFARHEVIFFRGQAISDEDQIRFSRLFGKLRVLKVQSHLLRDHPEIILISNIKENGEYIGAYDAGVLWHTDGANLPNPHAASVLRAIEIPERDGRTLGDTRFASTSAAYDALPAGMKRRLEGLKAIQSISLRNRKTEQAGVKVDPAVTALKDDQEYVHPVVRVHPVTGRKCLFVNEGYTTRILGLPEDESRDLIAELASHNVKPEFQYRHNWRVNDLLMWDNCATQHKATFDYALPLRRLLHRTTVMGTQPA